MLFLNRLSRTNYYNFKRDNSVDQWRWHCCKPKRTKLKLCCYEAKLLQTEDWNEGFTACRLKRKKETISYGPSFSNFTSTFSKISHQNYNFSLKKYVITVAFLTLQKRCFRYQEVWNVITKTPSKHIAKGVPTRIYVWQTKRHFNNIEKTIMMANVRFYVNNVKPLGNSIPINLNVDYKNLVKYISY